MEITKKWFSEDAPTNAYKASKNFGTGDNGIVTVYYYKVGTEGNDIQIEVVTQAGSNKPMSATFASGKLTVTLGKDGTGEISTTANTAKLISEAIDAIPEFESIYSGTGATAYVTPFEAVELSGGSYGTPCPIPHTVVTDGIYYYVNIAPNTIYDANWRRFQLSIY